MTDSGSGTDSDDDVIFRRERKLFKKNRILKKELASWKAKCKELELENSTLRRALEKSTINVNTPSNAAHFNDFNHPEQPSTSSNSSSSSKRSIVDASQSSSQKIIVLRTRRKAATAASEAMASRSSDVKSERNSPDEVPESYQQAVDQNNTLDDDAIESQGSSPRVSECFPTPSVSGGQLLERFNSIITRKRPKRSPEKEEVYECNECHKQFKLAGSRPSILKYHVGKHEDYRILCPKVGCDKMLLNRSLKCHMRDVHKVSMAQLTTSEKGYVSEQSDIFHTQMNDLITKYFPDYRDPRIQSSKRWKGIPRDVFDIDDDDEVDECF
ncbi:hypothetical protein QR680_006940 [Steinernema hermaphroditum]|uniref:C2H2-type domain-containing protein n=1 Tax=Steinernema hermaphroditum TaxID=289476 RepID=A0AA39HWZ4_9BILA|nr:hypothetical protein QR680_006940 [Steinernema hermaphroditum]